MAIVNMNKISIVGSEQEKRPMLNFLMDRGFVQIDDATSLLEEENFGMYLEKDGAEVEVVEIEQKIAHINQSLESIKKHTRIKKSFMTPKDDYEFFSVDEADDVFETALKINVLYKDLEAEKAQENSLVNYRDMLLPWVGFDVPITKLETELSKMILGTFPASAKLEDIKQRLDNEAKESILGTVNTDKQFIYVYVIAHKEVQNTVVDVLKDFGFTFITLNPTGRTPAEGIKAYNKRIEESKVAAQKLIDAICAYSNQIPAMENLHDYYMIKREERKTVEKLVKTKTTFCLSGWLPTGQADDLSKELLEQFCCFVETEKGDKEEGFPVLLENNRLVTPFESVTNMYSTPNVKDADPNTIMAFFYIIFFGMMLADLGYGVIMALLCGFMVKKAKMKKGTGNLYKLLALCGISTAVWGVIFGSFFGGLIPMPALIDPLEDVMLLMGMSLLFGIIHIYVGLGIKAYTMIKNGKVLDALFDVGLWYFFVTGICMLIIPVVAGPVGNIAVIGKYLAIIGAVGLFLTQGRSQKNVFMKGYKGLSSLYGITSYFADILSYSRLMALCLSSGVIGQVINLLGAIAGPIPAIFIGIIGHTANLLINALGAYVHTSRLQYVEFFSKFYEGGGIAFSPFKYKTKYTQVNTNKE